MRKALDMKSSIAIDDENFIHYTFYDFIEHEHNKFNAFLLHNHVIIKQYHFGWMRRYVILIN